MELRYQRAGRHLAAIRSLWEPMETTRRRVVGSAAALLVGAALNDPVRVDPIQGNGASLLFNIRAFGAKGNGQADDTSAMQNAVAAAIAAGSGRVYVPAGKYKLTEPIVLSTKLPIDVVGDGQSSILRWAHEGNAIWWKGVAAQRSSIRDLRIVSSGPKVQSAAICCDSGATDCSFLNLWIDGDGDEPSIVPIGMIFGDGKPVTDQNANTTLNVAITNCFFSDISHVGLSLGPGGEVRVLGGRFISAGSNGYHVGSIGILLCGWMGGFHLTDTDISLFEVGMQIGAASRAQVPGVQQNREIFITHATPDSCHTGIAIYDASYVSIAGCWAASSKEAQVMVMPGAHCKLVIAGGTIFNGGHHPTGNLRGGQGNGVVMRDGTLLMTGVDLRSNVGKPIDLSPSVKFFISGCMFEDNGGSPIPIAGPHGLNSGW